MSSEKHADHDIENGHASDSTTREGEMREPEKKSFGQKLMLELKTAGSALQIVLAALLAIASMPSPRQMRCVCGNRMADVQQSVSPSSRPPMTSPTPRRPFSRSPAPCGCARYGQQVGDTARWVDNGAVSRLNVV